MSWHQAITSFLRSAKVMSMVGGVSATALYVSYTDWTRYPRMMATYARGNILPPMADNTFETIYFPRPELEQTLHRTFCPTFSNKYYVIIGGVGTGKTRSIVEVVRSMMRNDGQHERGAPIYVLANQGTSFADTLAAAVDYRFDEHISFQFLVTFMLRIRSMPPRDDANRLTRLLNAIEKSAFEYRQKYGRPVVIVIDSADYLSKTIPKGLEQLQEKAKIWADANIIKLVFVYNDAKTEAHLQSNAEAWSRVASPVFIKDMRPDEALSFLRAPKLMEHETHKKHQSGEVMNEQLARRVVDLVGGRILQLIALKRDWLDGVPFDVSVKELKSREREKMLKVWQNAAEWRVIEAVQASPGHAVPLSSLVQRVPFTDIESLVKRDIIECRRDPTSSEFTVAFRSQLAQHAVNDIQESFSARHSK